MPASDRIFWFLAGPSSGGLTDTAIKESLIAVHTPGSSNLTLEVKGCGICCSFSLSLSLCSSRAGRRRSSPCVREAVPSHRLHGRGQLCSRCSRAGPVQCAPLSPQALEWRCQRPGVRASAGGSVTTNSPSRSPRVLVSSCPQRLWG